MWTMSPVCSLCVSSPSFAAPLSDISISPCFCLLPYLCIHRYPSSLCACVFNRSGTREYTKVPNPLTSIFQILSFRSLLIEQNSRMP